MPQSPEVCESFLQMERDYKSQINNHDAFSRQEAKGTLLKQLLDDSSSPIFSQEILNLVNRLYLL